MFDAKRERHNEIKKMRKDFKYKFRAMESELIALKKIYSSQQAQTHE